jgi:hypothetical protein
MDIENVSIFGACHISVTRVSAPERHLFTAEENVCI